MSFSPERLKFVRMNLGISKAAAARKVNLTPMGYGRYENGDRIPSFQMICFIAQALHTSYEYLCEETDDPAPRSILISVNDNPDLFNLVLHYQELNDTDQKRLITYYKKLMAITKPLVDYTEDVLDEADHYAKTNTKHMSHKEVFSGIREQINSKASSDLT